MKEFLSALTICVIVALTILTLSPPRDPIMSRHQIEECERDWKSDHECHAVVMRPSRVWIIDWFGEHIDAISTAVTAAATVAVALFTLYLKRSSDQLWDVSDRQARIAHEEFVSTHRPRLRLIHAAPLPFIEDLPAAASLQIMNIGNTEAKIVAIGVDIFPRLKGVGNSGAYNAVPVERDDVPVIKPGQQAVLEVQGSQIMPVELINRVVRGDVPQPEMCLMGMIHYFDRNNSLRLTSFFRIYDPVRNRFVKPTEDDEHSHKEFEA